QHCRLLAPQPRPAPARNITDTSLALQAPYRGSTSSLLSKSPKVRKFAWISAGGHGPQQRAGSTLLPDVADAPIGDRGVDHGVVDALEPHERLQRPGVDTATSERIAS